MYNKSIANIIIGKVETFIDFKLGVKQVDSTPPVLFLFLIIAFSETLEDEWTNLELIKSQFARKYNSPISTGKLVSQNQAPSLLALSLI